MKKMLKESCRILGVIPQFSRVLRNGSIGTSKFFSTAAATKLEDSTNQTSAKADFDKFRFRYPEFIPCPSKAPRNAVREKLERRDMLRRRNNLNIPEFYVGSILAITTSDKHAAGKQAKFVGICIMKNNNGLESNFILRNVIQHQGVEVLYATYSPLILKIEVLKLEKRLDDTLYYLRDAPEEYSYFPLDMKAEYHDESQPVPVNAIKVPLNPRPWLQRYERLDLKGIILPELPPHIMKKSLERARPWEKYDLMDEYRKVLPEEDQKDIFAEVWNELNKLHSQHKIGKLRKKFVKPAKQQLF